MGKITLHIIFKALLDDLNDERSGKDIVNDIKEKSANYNIPEHEVIGLVSVCFARKQCI